jgi:hypothetical protein
VQRLLQPKPRTSSRVFVGVGANQRVTERKLQLNQFLQEPSRNWRWMVNTCEERDEVTDWLKRESTLLGGKKQLLSATRAMFRIRSDDRPRNVRVLKDLELLRERSIAPMRAARYPPVPA